MTRVAAGVAVGGAVGGAVGNSHSSFFLSKYFFFYM